MVSHDHNAIIMYQYIRDIIRATIWGSLIRTSIKISSWFAIAVLLGS